MSDEAIEVLALMDRISKGEAFLMSIHPNDPKRPAAESNLDKLRNQAAAYEQKPNSQAFGNIHDDLQRYEPPLIEVDPRPDLTDDSEKWTALLKMALERDTEFCGVLNGIRCGGTRIRSAKTSSGELRWILRPDIDPSGRLAWESQSDYEEMRDKYLKPHFEAVTVLLQRLADQLPPVDHAVQQEMRI